MNSMHSGALASYNSLQDEHLAEFYSHPRRLRHLRRMGLITKDGDIVDEATLRLNNALKQQKKSSKDALANSVVNKAIELERQSRIETKRKLELLAKYEMAEKVKKHVRHPVGVDDGFTPYPTQELLSTQSPQINTVTQRALRLGIDESFIATYMHTTAQLRKIISMRAPPSPYITKSFSMPIVPHPPPKPKLPSSAQPRLTRKKPKTSSCVEVSNIVNQRYPMRSHARVTMCYVGKSVQLEGSIEHNAMDVTILQQHCGGNTVCVFRSKVKPKTSFTFTSRRHKDCPFGISIYLDSMFDCRLSTCCEYKHQPGKMLGSKMSHFGLVKVEGGTPCYKCQGVINLMSPTSLSKVTNGNPVRTKPLVVTNKDIKESDSEFDVEDIVKRYREQPANGAAFESDSSTGSPHASKLQDKDQVDQSKQQELRSDSKQAPPEQDTPSSKESIIEPSKRRSVVFSPDTKELDNDEASKHQSLNTSQTIKDAKEILKKASSGHSFTSESDNDVLSSSSGSSTDVDLLESRVSQIESSLIPQPESKDDQSTSKLSDDQSSSGSSHSTTTSVGDQNSDQGNRSGSQSKVEHTSDQRLPDDQSSCRPVLNASDNDHQSTPQLNQSSSHSLDASKPVDGDQGTSEVDQNIIQHDQTTPDQLINQSSNQHDQNISHSDQDTNQTNNQSQNNDQESEQNTTQHNKNDQQSDQTSNEHDEGTNFSDQRDQAKPHQSETTTSEPTEQDHNAS